MWRQGQWEKGRSDVEKGQNVMRMGKVGGR